MKARALTYSELFNPGFMTEQTRFESIEAMLSEGGIDISSVDAFRATALGRLDQLAQAETQYDTWKAFTASAATSAASESIRKHIRNRLIRKTIG
jgi:hypothetical protein